MRNIVLVDTGCLIALTNIGELSLLAKTFDQPIATTASVASEFGLELPPFVRIIEMEDLATFKALRKILDDGEASLIALARTTPNPLLVLDDAKARQTALSYGLSIIGTLGIIVLAKEKSVIAHGAPYLQQLKIFYFTLRDEQRKEEKLNWFRNTRFQDIPFERITPDENGNWINLADTDFKTLLPLANKQTKLAKTKAQENAVFKLFSLGVVTARDEWVYDFDEKNLEKKVKFLIQTYNRDVERLHGRSSVADNLNYEIKWTRAVKNDLKKGKKYEFDKAKIIDSLYRPFCKRKLYFSKELNEMQYQQNSIFPIGEKRGNVVICVNHTSTKPFNVLAVNMLPDYHFNGDANCLPLYRYTESGARVENITDWALEQFRARYEPSPQPSPSGS